MARVNPPVPDAAGPSFGRHSVTRRLQLLLRRFAGRLRVPRTGPGEPPHPGVPHAYDSACRTWTVSHGGRIVAHSADLTLLYGANRMRTRNAMAEAGVPRNPSTCFRDIWEVAIT